jgi:uncharacterized protein YxjI
MALCIKEQVFSSVKKYTITDESGQLRYTTEGRAKGQFIVVGNQIHIFDPLGNEVAFVHKVLSFFHPKYELIIHGEKKRGDHSKNLHLSSAISCGFYVLPHRWQNPWLAF